MVSNLHQIELNRATERVTATRTELAKVDLQRDCLCYFLKQKDEEALAFENEIAILQAKKEGVRELQVKVQAEIDLMTTRIAELHKKIRTEEKEGTGQSR